MAVRDIVQAAAGVGGANPYIEDVFSTYLYTGTGSTQTITNGIDLAGEGGLVWIKSRNNSYDHRLTDTERGLSKALETNTTDAEATTNHCVAGSFNSDGFSLNNTGTPSAVNTTGDNLVSWTFRKAPKFFDCVTYTGTGSARTVAHNLGSVPGCIIVKRTDTASDWKVYHRSTGNTKWLELNTTSAEQTAIQLWNNTTPTDSVFTVGTDSTVNASGGTYVAYLFAHDAGGFGDDGLQNVISCGSYVGTGMSGKEINLGFEPQFVIFKNASNAANWYVMDTMRGLTATGAGDNYIFPNLADAEATSSFMYPTSTGFGFTATGPGANASGDTYIYIAIRRGPMKTPTSGTEVFEPIAYSGDNTNNRIVGTLKTPDLGLSFMRTSFMLKVFFDRLRNPSILLNPTNTDAEYLNTVTNAFPMEGASISYSSSVQTNASGTNNYGLHLFRRAPGFMDVCCYTGTGVAKTEAHNLGVVPELIITKGRSIVAGWVAYCSYFTGSPLSDRYITVNGNGPEANAVGIWGSGSVTSSVFSLGTFSLNNSSGNTYIAYLFATLAGVSKVGSYTGTGTTLQVDCGFSAGARFVMIKRTDSTGDWYVWDSARGIIAGNDPYLLLNTTTSEITNTDYIDPLASGFEISSTAPAAINASGGSFIFLAIA